MDPRIARTHDVARNAALAELTERGFAGVTVEGVAARSGIAKSTLYRHWDDAAAIVRDAVVNRATQPPPTPGTTRGRARATELLGHLSRSTASGVDGAALPAMVDAAARDAQVGATFFADNDRRRAPLAAAVAEAVEDGDAASHVTDPDLAATALAGGLVYRRLCTDRPVTLAEVDALVTTVLGPERDPA